MRRHRSFEAALDQVRSEPLGRDTSGDRPRAPGISAPLPLPEQEGHGQAYPWDHAAAWVPEHVPEPPPPPAPIPPPPPPRPPPSADPEDIARELKLSEMSSEDQLTRIRRRFMWTNHPDRYAREHERVANRRVAIANMLIDHALERLVRLKRPK